MEKKRSLAGTVVSGLMLVLSLGLTVGVKLWFSACGHPMENGMPMACHWAEQGVFAAGIVMSCVSLLALCIPSNGIRAGLSLALIPQAAVTALIPGVFINLCMMDTMDCHKVMRPAVIILCVLIGAVAAVNAFLSGRADKA